MKLIKIMAFVFLFVDNTSIGQNLNIGLKYEPFVLYTKLGTVEYNDIYFSSFYVQGGIKLNSKIQIEINYGLVLSEGYRFNGFETCLFGKYFIWERSEYIIVGYIFHKNGGDNGHYYRTEDKFLSLGTVGIGIFISELFFIQATYQIPFGNNEFGYRINPNTLDPNKNTYDKNKLVGLFKLGFGLSFDL